MSIRVLKKKENYEDLQGATEIALECGDDSTVIVPRSLLIPSVLALKIEASNTAISVAKLSTLVTSSAMLNIASWLSHYQTTTYVSPARPVTQELKDIYTSDFDQKFIAETLFPKGPDDTAVLFSVLRAAHALQIASLIDYCVVVVATTLRGKSDQELANLLLVSDQDFGNSAELSRAQQIYPWINSLSN